MFKAIVETKSHEGGLLAPFTGSSPALGSIIVRVDDGTYIGKIDAVLGNTDSPIAHIAPPRQKNESPTHSWVVRRKYALNGKAMTIIGSEVIVMKIVTAKIEEATIITIVELWQKGLWKRKLQRQRFWT